MEQAKLKLLILKVLKADNRLWSQDKTELNQTLLLDLVENIDETVIDLLLQEKDLREKFFVKIKDVYVFKTNDFRFFMEENKVDNSYTAYKNRIGLTDGKKFLKDTNDVVLDFPYKDCVLEGGQSTEEGTDTYFEYSEKAEQYEEKQGKRKEIFFNQILAHDEIDRLFDHKALTNWKRFTKNGEQEVKEIKRDEDGTIKENLIIKGNNLLALHSLKKQFAWKVKLIYIDPPYNTGNDGFKYNDSFNHSTWLTFMKNRLEMAKELLRDDGVIFISCDHNEQSYLKVLLDDNNNKLFGRENYIATLSVENNPKGRKNSNFISISNDFCLVYAKNINNSNAFFIENIPKNISDLTKDENGTYIHNSGKRVLVGESSNNYLKNIKSDKHYSVYYNEEKNEIIIVKEDSISDKDNDLINKGYSRYISSKNGKFLENTYTPNKLLELLKNNALVFREDKIFEKNFNTSIRMKSIIRNMKYRAVKNDQEIDFEIDVKTTSAGAYLKELFGTDKPIFENSKNIGLLKLLLTLSPNKDDIILDFHAGSGTTAHAVLELNKEDGGNRKFIMIEQMNYINTVTCPRVQKVMEKENIDDSFIYFELAKWNETAKEKILACKSLDELIKFFDEMYERYFLNYNLKIKEFREKVIKEEEFKNLSLDEQKKMFVAMLDNNQVYVNKTEMADKKFGIDKKDQKLTSQFYNSEK